MAPSRSIRLDGELIDAAELQGKAMHRSAPNQIEYWASLGRRLAPSLSHRDLLAISQGLARVRVEVESSPRVDPDQVLAAVATQSQMPFVSPSENPAPFQYESSDTPGYIDQVDAQGNRVTGKMVNGRFVPR